MHVQDDGAPEPLERRKSSFTQLMGQASVLQDLFRRYHPSLTGRAACPVGCIIGPAISTDELLYEISLLPKANPMANREPWHVLSVHISRYWPGQLAAGPELSEKSSQDILQPGTGRSKALDWAPVSTNGNQQGGARAADTRVGGASG